ncbi:MAG: hypothetical protein OXI80_08345 [Caldilineaceae bacterium]|nr:hypothetical protein [Caldilineaceae bacterium]MDE0337667.1 hypothetical protein [Caldilineaceae bacterium]
MKLPEKLKNLTMLDLARGPWLFILSLCGVLTGHMISELLPLRSEDQFKFSLIDTWPHVAGVGTMSLVFYMMARKAKDVSDFRRMAVNLAVKYFLVFAALATLAVFIIAALRMPIRELLDGPWITLLALFWGPVIVAVFVKYRFYR